MIYDPADWTLQEGLHADIADNRAHENWQQGFQNLLEALKAYQPLIQNACRSIDREQVERYMRREVAATTAALIHGGPKSSGKHGPVRIEKTGIGLRYPTSGLVQY